MYVGEMCTKFWLENLKGGKNMENYRQERYVRMNLN
jgi:hypothetical protein